MPNSQALQIETTEVVALQVHSDLQTSIMSFSPVMARYLNSLGLPTENVVAPIEERKKVIDALGSALQVVPLQLRERSAYLTRFAVAITVGLFDGALAYLWDETIKALRRLAGRFDLGYFFSVAEQISPRNKNFSTEDHLSDVSEHDLLEACRRIGLISDVNFKRLEHINFMRNHASSAHPNDTHIDGHEIVAWLANCLRHAIIAEPEHSVIKVKMLMENVRTQPIPASDVASIGGEIATLGMERVDDMLWTFFGLYVDPRQSADAKANIQNLAPWVWNAASEDRKYEIGAKYGTYRKNADVQRKQSADSFLDAVGGTRYKDEDSLAAELLEKLGTLKSAHFSWNNFYNEYPHAKILGESLPPTGVVPRAARPTWVKVISTCYVGNGLGYKEGVDESALPYYKDYVDKFNDAEQIEFLHLFSDPEFNVILQSSKVESRAKRLAQILRVKTNNAYSQRVLDLIQAAPAGTLDRLALTSEYKEAIKFTPKMA